MKQYIVYFEIYGKKLKTTIRAESEGHAKETIRNKIIFYKVKLDNDPEDYVVDFLKDLFK
jgi:hypothetical protein